MRTFLLMAAVCAIGILPGSARAGDKLMIADLPDVPRAAQIDGEEVLAIGVGVVIGAAAGYSFSVPAALIGGATGGLLSHWWYNRELDAYQPLPRRH